MKGSRAKREAAAAAGPEETPKEGGGDTKTPVPPEKPKDGSQAPRQHPGVPAELVVVQIPTEEYNTIVAQLRSKELMGAAAAEALEAAAGLGPPASPAGKQAKELRGKVAGFRSEEEAPTSKRRVSMDEVAEKEAETHDAEAHEAAEKDAPDPPEPQDLPELNLTPKQNHMRTDLEMWVMDEVPALYGVDDSEELDEPLQEDGQAAKITQLIAEGNVDAQKKLLNDWLKGTPDEGAKGEFMDQIIEKVGKIQALGPKKKKKKKKDA